MTLDLRIRTEIEQRIRRGELRPGDRIPFEHELAATYACSRATVSKALGAMARVGLIDRRRKAGSFVAHPQLHSAVLDVPDLAQMIEARGEAYAWQRSARSRQTAAEVGGAAVLIEGVHLGGGEAFAIERRLISLAAVPEAATEQFSCEAPGTWLLRQTPWTVAEHRIKAVEAAPAEARALGLNVRGACLELHRTTWRAEVVVTSVRQLFRGDRFDLVARFRPGTGTV